MARNFTIRLNSVYLTEDGLVGGRRCKTVVTGLDKAIILRKRNSIQASDGEVYAQISPAQNKGIDITIKMEFVESARYEEINSILDSVSNGGNMSLYIDGLPGTFDLTVWQGDNPIQSDLKFSGDFIENITYIFKTV